MTIAHFSSGLKYQIHLLPLEEMDPLFPASLDQADSLQDWGECVIPPGTAHAGKTFKQLMDGGHGPKYVYRSCQKPWLRSLCAYLKAVQDDHEKTPKNTKGDDFDEKMPKNTKTLDKPEDDEDGSWLMITESNKKSKSSEPIFSVPVPKGCSVGSITVNFK